MLNNFFNAYKEFWIKATEFKGFTSRSDWWLVQLANLIISFLTIPIFLKTFGETVGWGFHFQNQFFLMFILVLMLIFSLNLLGFFEIILPQNALYKINNLDFVIGRDLIKDIFYWKNFDKINDEVCFLVILREGYPVESNTLKMLETYREKYKISTIKIPNISSSKLRTNFSYSNLPTSLIDIVKKNNLYESTKLVE